MLQVTNTYQVVAQAVYRIHWISVWILEQQILWWDLRYNLLFNRTKENHQKHIFEELRGHLLVEAFFSVEVDDSWAGQAGGKLDPVIKLWLKGSNLLCHWLILTIPVLLVWFNTHLQCMGEQGDGWKSFGGIWPSTSGNRGDPGFSS